MDQKRLNPPLWPDWPECTASMPPASTNLRDSLQLAENRLSRAGVDNPRLSADLLVARILGVDRLWVLTHPDAELDPEQARAYSEMVGLRAAGRPVAYFLGKREFYGRDFQVTPDVLIPRPETEVLVERAGSLWPSGADLAFADAGTGCGAIGVCFGALFPNSRGVLTDRSMAALRVAQMNVAAHGLSSRLMCICADLVSACPPGSLDAVLSNPPYISGPDYWQLSQEIRHFEPALALCGGIRGTEIQMRLIQQARTALRAGGWLCMEVGYDQAPALKNRMQTLWSGQWSEVGVVQDLAGRDRVLMARKV